MEFQDVFDSFYTAYRGDSDIPDNTDPEWAIAIQHANSGIRTWESVDGILWDELYGTNLVDGDGDTSYVTGQTSYTAPSDMRTPGGFIILTNGAATTKINVSDSMDVQKFVGNNTSYAYFTGDPGNGYTLHLSLGGTDSQYSGSTLDYTYYKKATLLDPATEDGSTYIQMADPEFLVQTMLAKRFLESRNYTSYQVAKQSADVSLSNMEVRNFSNAPYNTFKMFDASDNGFGTSAGVGGIFGS